MFVWTFFSISKIITLVSNFTALLPNSVLHCSTLTDNNFGLNQLTELFNSHFPDNFDHIQLSLHSNELLDVKELTLSQHHITPQTWFFSLADVPVQIPKKKICASKNAISFKITARFVKTLFNQISFYESLFTWLQSLILQINDILFL